MRERERERERERLSTTWKRSHYPFVNSRV